MKKKVFLLKGETWVYMNVYDREHIIKMDARKSRRKEEREVKHMLQCLLELRPNIKFQAPTAYYILTKTPQIRTPFAMSHLPLQISALKGKNKTRDGWLTYFGHDLRQHAPQQAMLKLHMKDQSRRYYPEGIGLRRQHKDDFLEPPDYEYVLFAGASDTHNDCIISLDELHIEGTAFGHKDFPEFKQDYKGEIPHIYVFWGSGDKRTFLGVYNMRPEITIHTANMELARAVTSAYFNCRDDVIKPGEKHNVRQKVTRHTDVVRTFFKQQGVFYI